MVESVFTIYKYNPEMMVEWEGNNRETTFDWNIRILSTRDDINWYIVVTTMDVLFFFGNYIMASFMFKESDNIATTH